jgi:iron complex transport system substrate-binding protein
MRIVSLLPSATEIVCRLGLRSQLVGVSHECDWPPDVRELPKVTQALIPSNTTSGEIDELVHERINDRRALYRLDLPALDRLRPDLIVTQALCNVCAVAEADVQAAVGRMPREPLVVNLEPTSLEDVLECLRIVGRAAGCEVRASKEIAKLKARIAAVESRSTEVPAGTRPRVVVLEWIDPPFSSGHWTPELVRLAGGREMIGHDGQRSHLLDWRQIVGAAPEVLLVACCGFHAERALAELPHLSNRPGWSDLPCVRSQRVYVVDGSSYFNRPGPRLVDSLEIVAHTLHPAVHPLPPGLEAALRIGAGGV